jgi:hypothetical protein
MKSIRRFAIVGFLSLLSMIGFGATPGIAQPRAHVYLLRGLMNIFSLGMDTLAEKIQRRGIYAVALPRRPKLRLLKDPGVRC